MANLYVQVGIDAPLFNLFDYHWNEESLGAPPKIGTLVKLEFGKKLTTGIVLRVSKTLSYTERAGKKSNVKDILGLAPIARLPVAAAAKVPLGKTKLTVNKYLLV